MTGIARLTLVALDTADPNALADFYSELTGWPVGERTDDWIELVSPVGATVAFQLAPGHAPPEWPGDDHPQQMHLDFAVDDLEHSERAVLEIGARKTAVQPEPDRWRVFLDPAGHPFCLVRAD